MKNKFSVRLKELRTELKLSQFQLSQSLGFAQSTLAMWESGTREPNIDTLILLASYFNITLDELVGIDKTIKNFS